ncbi:protein AMEIOTIC 1 homolog isoform X2 [Euphorbia lathyris]
MVQWREFGQVSSVDQHEDPTLSSFIIKEEQNDEDVVAASCVSPPLQKKRRLNLCQLKEARAARRLKQKQTTVHKQIKHENSIVGENEISLSSKKGFTERWSTERYKLAEKRMLDVMKAEGALFENPIPRSVLRMAARKYIPDTGLLDHLLKHIDGKVAPGGTERFRRCYNTEGMMEYWLENADLVKVKQENGVPNSNWVPQSCWIPGSATVQQSVSTGELALLKEEIAKLKRDMEELSTKNKDQNQVSPVEEMLKELVTWRIGTDQRLIQISSSLSGIQNIYQDLNVWKSKIEQKLMEISNSSNSAPAPKQCSSTLTPVSERWEDWLASTNLDNIRGEDLAPWIGSTDIVNVGQDALLQECSAPQPWLKPPSESLFQEPNCARDLELLKEEMAQVKRDVHYLLPTRAEDAQASVTPDSSSPAMKFDIENPFLLFQETFKELMKWKAKMEEQMLEIWNAVSNLQASKQYTA